MKINFINHQQPWGERIYLPFFSLNLYSPVQPLLHLRLFSEPNYAEDLTHKRKINNNHVIKNQTTQDIYHQPLRISFTSIKSLQSSHKLLM